MILTKDACTDSLEMCTDPRKRGRDILWSLILRGTVGIGESTASWMDAHGDVLSTLS